MRVIAPNMRQAILNALLLTSALVLGEFTVAYNLFYYANTCRWSCIPSAGPRRTPECSSPPPFAALLFAFVLLLILSYVGRRRRGRG